MGIILITALDAAATYAADVLTAPLPAAVAAVLAVLMVIGLRILGNAQQAPRPNVSPASWLRRRLLERSPRWAAAAVLLPRLPQRLPQTRPSRPADAPDVAALGLLRGPPGPDSRPRWLDTGGGLLPR